MTPAESGKQCILVVDGCEDSRALLGKICVGKLCFPVHQVASAAEALDWLREHIPNLIITDLYLPDMPGLELSRRIRLLSALQHIPIIGITSWLRPEDPDIFLDAGLTDFFIKPVEISRLVSCILRLLATPSPPEETILEIR